MVFCKRLSIVLLGLLCILPIATPAQTAGTAQNPPAPLGKLVDVGGHRVHLYCARGFRDALPRTSSAGLGKSRADNHGHGETERNRLSLSYSVRSARATKLRFFQGLVGVGATLGAEWTEIMPNTVQRHTPKS